MYIYILYRGVEGKQRLEPDFCMLMRYLLSDTSCLAPVCSKNAPALGLESPHTRGERLQTALSLRTCSELPLSRAPKRLLLYGKALYWMASAQSRLAGCHRIWVFDPLVHRPLRGLHLLNSGLFTPHSNRLWRYRLAFGVISRSPS